MRTQPGLVGAVTRHGTVPCTAGVVSFCCWMLLPSRWTWATYYCTILWQLLPVVVLVATELLGGIDDRHALRSVNQNTIDRKRFVFVGHG